MPIRAELRKYYGPEWRAFRLSLIADQGTRCSECGTDYGPAINGAHKDHDPRSKRSVKLMCPSCHARHDAPHRLAIMRRRRASSTGQLWLTDEMEWAPFANWEIPGRIFDRLAQLPLFREA